MKDITLQHRLEFWGYRGIEKLIYALPDHTLPGLARFFAFLAYRILGIRKKVTLDNLKIAFPESTEAWRERTAYRSYLHFAMVMLEFMKMGKWSADQLRTKMEILEIDDFTDAQRQEKGVVIVSGHFGNWEVAIGYLHLLDVRSAVIQQRQKNALVNERMKVLREKWGMEIIYPRGAVKESIKALRKGKAVALLGDQDAGDRGVFVPFFGRMSSTHVGAALMALKTGAPVILGICTRTASNHFKLEFQTISDSGLPKNLHSAVEELTARHTRMLEAAIRKNPEQYFWMHRRWKTPPKD